MRYYFFKLIKEVYLLVVFLIIALTGSCTLYMFYKLFTSCDQSPIDSFAHKVILACTGVVSFVADAVGVGSFAINIAVAKTLKLVKDSELPGFVNGAQVIPGAVSAIYFLGVFHVDFMTLVVLVVGTTLGGFLGGVLASKVHVMTIRLMMIMAFMIVLFLLLSKLFGILPVGGTLMKLSGIKLVAGFVGMFFAGFLVCFGVGLFALVQAILFLLGLSPIIAFPIMTTAGAIQQPVSTFAFLINNAIPLKKVLIVGLFGVVGVLIGVNIVSILSTTELQWLLVIVIGYNTISLIRAVNKSKH